VIAAPIVGENSIGMRLAFRSFQEDPSPGYDLREHLGRLRFFDLDQIRRIFAIMADVVVLTLSPIQQSDFWRVEMTWPGHSPRYFGWFVSQSDAERWIEEHRWLTTPKSP
jgi:hypothetical protein